MPYTNPHSLLSAETEEKKTYRFGWRLGQIRGSNRKIIKFTDDHIVDGSTRCGFFKNISKQKTAI